MGCSNSKVKVKKFKGTKQIAKEYKSTMLSSKSKMEDIKILQNALIVAKRDSVGKYYKIIDKVGSGTYGKVYKVLHLATNSLRAMKVVKIETLTYQDDDKTFLKEIEVLSILNHPNIIKLYEYYVDDVHYYFITDFAEGGELYDKIYEIKNYQESDSASIMEQLLSAVSYMHSKNIVHRDIKPENILLETKTTGDLSIKIIDFGTANFFENDTKLRLKVGTPYYIAPEVLKKEYSYKCDIWSCGVIMYILLSGNPPFDGSDDEEILNKVLLGGFTFGKEFNNVSDDAKELIKKLLTYDSKKRISAEEALQHNWIVKYANLSKEKNKEALNDAFVLRKPFEMLRRYNAKQKLQQATIAFLVHHSNCNEMVKDLRRIFKEFDVNGDGTLSYDEIKQGFKKFYKDEKLAEKEIEELIKRMDQGNNQCIEYEEFLRATINLEDLLTDENLQLAFNSFDADNSGKLSMDEIRKVLGVDESESDNTLIQTILTEIDANGDGEISFDEFKDLMEKVLKGD